MTLAYPPRLIEVDLPIKRISAHARREKSIRHGHISTLHIWWARRPLAACRAVICAALWPDPADEQCPPAFREAVAHALPAFAEQVRNDQALAELCAESWQRWKRTTEQSLRASDSSCWPDMRYALLDFIADFANWDASTVPAFLETARQLTQAAHEALGGLPGSRPLVVDPFAGGGAIPLEALRVGADAFASDLNPVAVLLNKVVLEYIPRYGQQLADEVRRWGQWVKEQAEAELAAFYPADPDGATPIAYLWARTIISEAPGQGDLPVEVPLMRSLWLAKKSGRNRALRWQRDANGQVLTETLTVRYADGSSRRVRRPLLEIFEPRKAAEVEDGTVARGSATCPLTGYTTPVESVRRQLKASQGGSDTSRLIVVVRRSDSDGKTYRIATSRDLSVIEPILESLVREDILPPVTLPLMSGVFNVPIYGIDRWDLLFSARQLYTADIIANVVNRAAQYMQDVKGGDLHHLSLPIKVLLLLSLDKYLDFRSTLCGWISVGEKIGHTFGRQALGMIFDWTEGVPFGDISGSWQRSFEYIVKFLELEIQARYHSGVVEQLAAQTHSLSNDIAQAFVTDPPYYNAVPYADLSDFFYIWLRKGLSNDFPELFPDTIAPKNEELCEMKGWDPVRYPNKDTTFYESGMKVALAEGHRICVPSGIGVVVFAHKTTSGWEAVLSALIDAGWTVTGSWPVDTERSGRLRAMDSAALASSVHLVCRPRQGHAIGDWRDVLHELPQRIGEWMPRLVAEGVVGADAIFACLGPALEIFSRYEQVEKASGERISLKEYLEYVWAAVSREALSTIFSGADTLGFEEDARLTVMWLWTLSAGTGSSADEEADEPEELPARPSQPASFALEYDTARKIAQGLGADLAKIDSVVEIRGDKARLLAVGERARALFGKDGVQTPAPRGRKAGPQQLGLFDAARVIDEVSESSGDLSGLAAGATVLDRLHQAMLLFGAGRGDALRRFLVDDGIGADQRLWRLAQALSALYPIQSQEKRWVDGVLARKKGLGL